MRSETDYQKWFYRGCWLVLGLACQLRAEVLYRENFTDPAAVNLWRQVEFHKSTDYQPMCDGKNSCIRATARGTCSAFATKLEITARPEIHIAWRWKIDRCPPGASDDDINTFDHAARVFVAFDTWIGPPRTINYVWANRLVTNSTFDHPLTRRARFIVLQTGNTNAGRWLPERRDIQKDWQRLFKDERMPKIVGIGVFTDSHHTGQPVTAWYGDLLVEAVSRPADNDSNR